MLRLFIENKEIELTDDVQVAITKQFEDLSNPTAIINDWSKTVSIPFTTNNNRIFGHIYSPNKMTTYIAPTNLIGSTPDNQKRWSSSAYVVDNTLYSNGVITYTDTEVEWLQVGFQYQDWKYSDIKNYRCTNDSHSFDFIYHATDDYRFEFSFRKGNTNAPNQEVCFVQWNLYNKGLVEGKTYTVSFRHKKVGNTYTISEIQLSEKQSMTGINFNPLLKLDFRLEWNGAVLMTGYAKMNSIKQVKGKGTYDVTLFGQLGKVFQEMQKITFDKTNGVTEYYIDGSKYERLPIKASNIEDFWYMDEEARDSVWQQGLSEANSLGMNSQLVTGWAPNNTYSEDFNCDTFMASSDTAKKFDEYLDNSMNFQSKTGIPASSVVGKGLLPREMAEFRMYRLTPYIYFEKLFAMFQNQAEKVTGYNFVLDSTWFSQENPYWYNLVYMLKNLDISGKNNQTNTYSTSNSDFYWHNTTTTTIQQQDVKITKLVETYPIVEDFSVTPGVFKVGDDYSLVYAWNIGMELISTFGTASASQYKINSTNAIRIYVDLINTDTSAVLSTENFIVYDSEYTGSLYGIPEANRIKTGNFSQRGTSPNFEKYWSFNLTSKFNVKKYNASRVNIRLRAGWVNTTPRFIGYYDSMGRWETVTPDTYLRTKQSNSVLTAVVDKALRSYSYYTINDIWDNNYKIFDEIIKYCKIYRIGITVNDIDKTITFKPINRYFENYEILDWTDKVDKSKDFNIKPVSFEDKYIMFNYNDSNTQLGKDYKEKYGVNYGDYKLTTEYNFNDKTNKLFDKVTTSFIGTMASRSFERLGQGKISYMVGGENFPLNSDKDGKEVSIFGAYYFWNGIAEFESSPNFPYYTYVTDDSPYEINNQMYCYNRLLSNYRVFTEFYPNLDIVRGNDLCLFNVPMANYSYNSNYSGKRSIYHNFWEKYINERYNVQNKLVTCYIRLKPSEYMNFKWGNFIKIDNTLYVVNKIYDYDVTSSESVKMDLITVQDITAYTTTNYTQFLPADTSSNGSGSGNSGGGNSGGGNSEELG